MQLEQQNVLFFTRTMNLGGTENVVLQLCGIFKSLVNNVVVCSCGGVNVEKLKEMGIRHYEIGDPEDKNPKNIIKNCKAIKQIVRDEHITVIHTHHRMAAFYVRLLGLDKHCKFINTSHNTFNNRKLLTRFAYKNCNLIACGEMVKKNLTDVYGLNNVTVIHNAVKPFEGSVVVDERLKKDKQEGNFLIGNIGRLSEQKGMEYFIRAIPAILKSHPEVQFYIIGSGEDEEKLKSLASDLSIKEKVVFMGYRHDVQNLMSQLDLVVLSSLWEGLPLTPIEAFSVGKTIVATGVDGTLEIVQDGKNGLLVEPRNSESIADKVIWMIEHPTELCQMEKEAKQCYADQFSFVTQSKSYADYYRSI